VRIGAGVYPHIKEADFYSPSRPGDFRVDGEGGPALLDSLLYKLCYYRFGEMRTDYRQAPGYDIARGQAIAKKARRTRAVEIPSGGGGVGWPRRLCPRRLLSYVHQHRPLNTRHCAELVHAAAPTPATAGAQAGVFGGGLHLLPLDPPDLPRGAPAQPRAGARADAGRELMEGDHGCRPVILRL
jgi:hypothetical protein